jgi:glycosyltransferase
MHDNPLLSYRDGFAAHRDIVSVPVIRGGAAGLPRVSIMIPTFRRVKLLREAIMSALAQETDVAFEVCVIDNDAESNGDVDELVRSISDPRLSLYRNSQNIGMFGNWNRCLELARGEFVSILNDDDKLNPHFVRETTASTRGNSLVFTRFGWFGEALSYGRVITSKAKNVMNSLFRRGALTVPEIIWAYPFVGTLGLLLNKEAACELGGFFPDLYPISDRIFLVRYLLQHGSVSVSAQLADYRWEANESMRKPTAVRTFEMEGYLRTEMIEALRAPDWLRSQFRFLDSVIRLARRAKLERQFAEVIDGGREDLPSMAEAIIRTVPGGSIGLSVLYAQIVSLRGRVSL